MIVQTSADSICRGVARALAAADHAVLPEMPLANGRRADLVAVGRDASIAIVEVKSTRADFLTDRKWPEYLEFCDLFYFAVAEDFPHALLPDSEGMIIADRFMAEIVRNPRLRPLSAARRKAMLLRFGRAAATRLHALCDPFGTSG